MQAIIKDLLAHMKTTEPVAGTFAHLLMSTLDPCSQAPLTDKQMVPEISSLFFAGRPVPFVLPQLLAAVFFTCKAET